MPPLEWLETWTAPGGAGFYVTPDGSVWMMRGGY